MTRLCALVDGSLCAAALGRSSPHTVEAQIRCLDEGSRALGLSYCCAPWPDETASALAVTAGLVATPGCLDVVGRVRGPVSVAQQDLQRDSGTIVFTSDDDDEALDYLDDATDDVAGQVRQIKNCGVELVAVVEQVSGEGWEPAMIAETHEMVCNVAQHLRLQLILVATSGSGLLSDGSRLGYERWVSPRGCSAGLGFLPSAALTSADALRRHLRERSDTCGADLIVTAPLDDSVSVAALRRLHRLVVGNRSS